jgi:hypothetical protein
MYAAYWLYFKNEHSEQARANAHTNRGTFPVEGF